MSSTHQVEETVETVESTIGATVQRKGDIKWAMKKPLVV